MEIINDMFNDMILSSILELLPWSTGKVCTCFCNTKKKNQKFGQCVEFCNKQVQPNSIADRGGARGPCPPGPVKISHKKDGCRIRSHRFHVSRPSSTQALDPLLPILNTHSMSGSKISRGQQSQKWGVISLHMWETTVMHEPAGVVEILVQILQNTPILKYSFRITPPSPKMKIVRDLGTLTFQFQNTPPPPKLKFRQILALWLFSYRIPPSPINWNLGRSWHFDFSVSEYPPPPWQTMCGKFPHVETLSSPDNYSFCYYRPQRSCGKIMFYSVCHSVHGLSHPPPGQTPLGRHHRGKHTRMQTPPGHTPPAKCMLGYTHPCPAQCILGYMSPLAATAADGTHPTGMLSCLNFNFNLFLIPIAWTDPRFPGGSNARCGASIYYLAKVCWKQLK